MGGFVRTLTGDISPDDLGPTLIHEHLSVDWGELLGRPKVLDFDRAELVDRMVGRMEELAAVGFGGMTECTPYGTGRYVDLFHEVARRSPVRIVGSTGFFHESWCPMHPVARALDLDGLVDLMTREVTEGMGDTLIRAGLIKVATGAGRISANEEKVVRAAARVHRSTGCPVICHITDSMSLELLDLFASEGVGPDEVIVSHVGHAPDPIAEVDGLIDRGANFAFDRIGFRVFFEDAHWLRLIGHVVRRGAVGRVMLSHDAGVLAYGLELASSQGPWDDYAYIGREFLPRLLRTEGITPDHVRTMVTENPRRVLAFG